MCASLVATSHAATAQSSDVVLYATDAATIRGNWSAVSDASAAGGILLASVDRRGPAVSAPLPDPADYVEFHFDAQAGLSYRLWLRLRADHDSKLNDALWVQFSDALDEHGAPIYAIGTTNGLLVNLADEASGRGLSGWGWQNAAYWLTQPTSVQFVTAGSHTVRLQIREDGVQFDQLVLSPMTYFAAPPGPLANDTTIVPKPAPSSDPPPSDPPPPSEPPPSDPPPPDPPPPTSTISVPEGGDLQAAIDSAHPGDTILLQPGAVYTGTFVLRGGGSELVTLRTAPDPGLPGDGARVTPAHAPLLAKIRSGSSLPAVQTAAGAHHWRLMLLELQATASGLGEILRLGDASSAQNSLSQVPHDLVIDRVYVHGDPSIGQKRGIALNSATTVITGCYVSDIKAVGQDSQAIAGWNGPGPYLITNNYLEAAGENILFGGADPFIPNLVPANITITDNFVAKLPAWRTQSWSVKNLLELKNARHVQVGRNTFEYNWQAAQTGYAILFTVRNQGGGCPWCQVDHVRFEQNIVRHTGAGFQILGYDYTYPSQQTRNIEVRDNLIYDIDPSVWGGNGYLLTLTGGAAEITLDHNTVIQNNASGVVQLDGPAVTGFTYTNNLSKHNAYGFIGTNHGVGNDSINWFLPGAIILKNVLAGGVASAYPSGNFLPTVAEFESQFASYANSDYRLSPLSTWRGAGTDGRDLGTAPSIPGTIQAEHFDEGGEGVSYHDSTAGNSGGAYWPGDVDIEPATEGGYDVSWITAGEWLGYSVDVAATGTYLLEARVSAPGPGGRFHVEAAGRDVSGPLTVPDTGGGQNWTTISVPVTLDAGRQWMRVVFDAAGSCCVGNLNWIRFTDPNAPVPPPPPPPSPGFSLPGAFQAADYDEGGEGVAYHDTTGGNSGGQYRADDVDIESSSLGGYDVGWIASGEWLAYTVTPSASGTYQLLVRVSSPYTTGRLHATLGGSTTATVSIPQTGGWQNWTTVTLTAPGVATGTQVLRLYFDTGGFNVADIVVTQ